jgi:hypothetical protein
VITNSGNYSVTLDVSPTVSNLVVGATGGTSTQTFNTGSQTLTANGIIDVTTQGVFNLNGGALTGTAVLYGMITWTGGSMGSPASRLAIAPDGVLVVTGGVGHVFGGILTNAGTIQLVSGDLQFLDCQSFNANLVNLPGALVDIQADVSFDDYGCGAEDVLFSNAGTVRKSGGTGTTGINVPFNSTGLLDVQTGTVKLASTSSGYYMNSGSGQFVAEAGTTLAFNSGYTEVGGIQFLGAGTNLLSAGTFTLNGTIVSSNAVLAGGSIASTNGVISGVLTWTGGSMGSPASRLMIATNGTLVVTGGVGHVFGGILTNAGTIQLASGDLQFLDCQSFNANLVNLPGALVDIQADVSFDDYGCGAEDVLFSNAGTVRKSGGTGTTGINVPFNNTGLLDVQTGTVNLDSTSSSYYASSLAGGTLNFGINGVGSFGRVNLGSPLALATAGTLQAQLGGGYTPNPGDGFTLLTYPSVTGISHKFRLTPASAVGHGHKPYLLHNYRSHFATNHQFLHLDGCRQFRLVQPKQLESHWSSKRKRRASDHFHKRNDQPVIAGNNHRSVQLARRRVDWESSYYRPERRYAHRRKWHQVFAKCFDQLRNGNLGGWRNCSEQLLRECRSDSQFGRSFVDNLV